MDRVPDAQDSKAEPRNVDPGRPPFTAKETG